MDSLVRVVPGTCWCSTSRKSPGWTLWRLSPLCNRWQDTAAGAPRPREAGAGAPAHASHGGARHDRPTEEEAVDVTSATSPPEPPSPANSGRCSRYPPSTTPDTSDDLPDMPDAALPRLRAQRRPRLPSPAQSARKALGDSGSPVSKTISSKAPGSTTPSSTAKSDRPIRHSKKFSKPSTTRSSGDTHPAPNAKPTAGTTGSDRHS
jgi:hypothetical protein